MVKGFEIIFFFFFSPHWIWLCLLGSPRSFLRTFAFLSPHTRVSPEKPRAGSPRCAGLRVPQTLGIRWVLKGFGFPAAQLEGKMWQIASRFTRQRGWPCYFQRASGPGDGKCQSGQSPLERSRLYSGNILQPRVLGARVLEHRWAGGILSVLSEAWWNPSVWEIFLFWQTEKSTSRSPVLLEIFQPAWKYCTNNSKFSLF